MKKIFAFATAAALALTAAPVLANGGKHTPKLNLGKTEQSAGFGFSGGVDVANMGGGIGKISGAESTSWKDLSGGGDAGSNTNGKPWATSNVSVSGGTMGRSFAASLGRGESVAETGELGMIEGAGHAFTYSTNLRR